MLVAVGADFPFFSDAEERRRSRVVMQQRTQRVKKPFALGRITPHNAALFALAQVAPASPSCLVYLGGVYAPVRGHQHIRHPLGARLVHPLAFHHRARV